MSHAPPPEAEGGGGPHGQPLQYPLEEDVVQPGEHVPQPQGEPLAAGSHMKSSHLILWKVRSEFYLCFTDFAVFRVVADIDDDHVDGRGHVAQWFAKQSQIF